MWKGEVNLRDLKLRRDALDKLDLPINVSEGYLGELTLIIPWANLRTEPVKVIIDHVYLLAEPKNELSVTVEEEEERLQQMKQRKLSTAEMLESTKEQQPDQKNESGNDGFLAQLTTKIIDNLQFTMKNIHIRYEDHISDTGHLFAAGITLKELSALSTDGNWEAKFISEHSNTINKLASLESLSVYWNTDTRSLAGMHHEEASEVFTELIPSSTHSPREHQYILKPVSGTGKVKLNKEFDNTTPKTDVTLLFDELAFSLDDHQYRDATLMLDLFHSNLKKQNYLKFHPGKGKTAKTHPKEFLKFAMNAIYSEVHEKHYKWSWDHFRKRRDQRLQYIDAYIAEKTKGTPEQAKQLAEYERILSFEDIRFYRSIANSKMRREKLRIAKENEKKKAENAKKGWWGWMTGSKSEETTGETVQDESDSIQMTEEQKKELYDAIEYDEEKAMIASAVDIPKDTIKFSIKTQLKKGSFNLIQNAKKKNQLDLLNVVFDLVSIDVTQYVESMKVMAALGDLQVYDGSTKGTLYPQFIGVKKVKDKGFSLLDIRRNKTIKDRKKLEPPPEESPGSTPFFRVVYEKKPLTNQADNAVSLTMRHLEIIYSPVLISGIMEFFKPPSSKMESINALIAVAGDTLEDLRVQTRAGLEYALETHTTMDLNVNMDAPIIIIPESLTTQNATVMVVDAGHINVDSKLADKDLINNIKGKDEHSYSTEDMATLESLMYDKFNLQLTQTKVLIGDNANDCLKQLNDTDIVTGTVNAHFIKKIDMNFLVEVCILPGKTEFTKIKVSGHVPLLSVNMSDSKYKSLMKIVDFVVPKDENQGTDMDSPDRIAYQELPDENISRLWGIREDEIVVPDYMSEGSIKSSASSIAESIKIAKAEIEQFKITFTVDRISAAINETCVDNPKKETLLCDVVLENFELVIATRSSDFLIDISLRALNVIDKIEHFDEFPYLITSDILDTSDTSSDTSTENLVNVKYRKCNKDSPFFYEVYEGYDQTIDIGLSTLTVIITRTSLLRLYGWMLNTFTGPSTNEIGLTEIHDEPEELERPPLVPRSSSGRRSSSFLSDSINRIRPKRTMSRYTLAPEEPIKPEEKQKEDKMKLAIHMDSVNLVLNNDGKSLATGKLSVGSVLILLGVDTLEVNGRFGNFTLSDDTHLSKTELDTISILGDELADFTYQTFDSDAPNYPGYSQMFKLKMGAIQIVLTDSIKITLDFLSEFLEMKAVYDAARSAAVETAQNLQEEGKRFHFDVIIRSPILVFPPRGPKNTHSLVANLGEIRANNEFNMTKRRSMNNLRATKEVPVSRINCGLYDVNLKSVDKGLEEVVSELPIIHNLDIDFKIESLEKPEAGVGPNSKIVGNISDVQMSLNENQFKDLMETWTFIQSTFLSSPTTDEKKEDESHEDERRDTVSSGSMVSGSSQGMSNAPFISLDMVIQLNTICLDILNVKTMSSHVAGKSLARLAFDDIYMKLQTSIDSSMLMEVGIRSVSSADTRAESNSKFKEILPANTLDGPQIQFKMSSFTKDAISHMNIQVTVDTPKVILSLDFLFLLKDFFMSPFINEPQTESQRIAQSYSQPIDNKEIEIKPVKKVNEAPTSIMNYKVVIVDLLVMCIASPEKEASEAVMLSFNQLMIEQEKSLTMELEGIGMVLCRMDNIKDSSVYFVKDFGVHFIMETQSPSSVHNVTSIKLDVLPIILRLSYQDAMLISFVANKVIELMGTANTKTESLSDDEFDHDPSYMLVKDAPVDKPTPDVSGIEPYIVMIRESVTATFDGIQIILIEDLHELPFLDIQIDPFTLSGSDWSRDFNANVDFSLKVNNFNFKNSHWEPFIEPWEFLIKVNRGINEGGVLVGLHSDTLMYLNITHDFVESCLSISKTLSELQPLAENAQNVVKPYLLRNMTGYDLDFWNMTGHSDIDLHAVHSLKQGESMPWTFMHWKQRRERMFLGNNLLGVKIKKWDWKNIHHITVDKEGQTAYGLHPNVNGIRHRLVVDIQLENHVKVVTFRSGLTFKNSLDEYMELAVVNASREILCESVGLEPGEVYNVPITLSYGTWAMVRPSEKYDFSSEIITWSDLMLPDGPTLLECTPIDNTVATSTYKYLISSEFDRKNPLINEYPFVNIGFCPPIAIENLLPFDFDLYFTDEATNEHVTIFIEKGKSAQLHTMKNDSKLLVQLKMSNINYTISEVTPIQLSPRNIVKGQKLIVKNDKGIETALWFDITQLRSTTNSLKIIIYAPYLIVNKFGLPIALRQYSSYRQSKGAIQSIPAYEEGERIPPAIYSYTEIDHGNRSQISTSHTKWSDEISFEAIGSSQDTRFTGEDGKYIFHAGIKVEEGGDHLRLSKIVTITPRYILQNNMDIKIRYCEFGFTDESYISPGEKKALYKLSKSKLNWISLQLPDLEDQWSSPIDINNIGKTYIKVSKGGGMIPYLVRVSISIKGATLFITFNEDAEWPFMLENRSTVPVQIAQENIDVGDFDLMSKQRKALKKPHLFTIEPGASIKYSWDFPLAKDKKLELYAGNRRRMINFEAIGVQVPFHYYKSRESSRENNSLAIDIIARDAVVVLRLTDYDKSHSLYRLRSLSGSSAASVARDDSLKETFETIDVEVVLNYSFELRLAGLGISLVDKEEIAYATIKDLDLKYSDSNIYQSYRLRVGWLQIDNQMYGSTYPILCYPTTLPKATDSSDTHPTLHVSLDRVKDEKHGVMYFKLFSILLQEMTFEVDEVFLFALNDFAKFDSVLVNNDHRDDLFVMTIEKPEEEKADALYYFEEFCIQPMLLNVSIAQTESIQRSDAHDSTRSSAFGYVFNVFTMTIGNINDAPIKMNAMIIDNLRCSSQDLVSRIYMHYYNQVIYQIYRVVGSIDILGNPVGLFNTLSSGFGELFYEPYHGFVMSDRPQDLGLGIAKGVGGFMKKSVFGVTDSMSRFTGSLGKGLSAATMDKKFQTRRKMNMTRNKPHHAIAGVTQGVEYLGTSLASGVVGLVKRPIEGAQEAGAIGFAGGIGKGLVG
ncbi:hypothetical protein BDB01DRAFT_799548 [Pilobolus umbonatus]|nr:hypothetical protein BDB01DRAFT_799548 [Pilobolus umbonatus]